MDLRRHRVAGVAVRRESPSPSTGRPGILPAPGTYTRRMEEGLCGRCRFARAVTTAKGSRFLRCGRSDEDARFPRYPSLPVRACEGFEAAPASNPSPPVEIPLTALGREPSPESAGPTLFERLGGRESVERLVDAFYDRIERDRSCGPSFPRTSARAARSRSSSWSSGWAERSAIRADTGSRCCGAVTSPSSSRSARRDAGYGIWPRRCVDVASPRMSPPKCSPASARSHARW